MKKLNLEAAEAEKNQKLERRARLQFVREHPRFEEELSGSGVNNNARLFKRIQEVKDYAEVSSSKLESKVGLVEIKQTHYSTDLVSKVKDVQEVLQRLSLIAQSGIGGGGGGGGGGEGEPPIIVKARQIFAGHDVDQSGTIDVSELSTIIDS